MMKNIAYVFLILMFAMAVSIPPIIACGGVYGCQPSPRNPPVIPTPSIPSPTIPTPTIPSPTIPPWTPYVPGTPGRGTPGGGSPGGGIPGGSGGHCPIDALKLGACVDLLNNLVHVGIGDPIVNQCCPLVQGVAALELALCLCTTIRAKVLNLNVLLPLALQLFAQCGLTPPPGFTCPRQS